MNMNPFGGSAPIGTYDCGMGFNFAGINEAGNPRHDRRQRQIVASLDSMKNQLNFAFQTELKNEQDAFNYFMN